MTGTYRLAGVIVSVESQFADVHELCRAYSWTGKPDISVVTGMADIEFERLKSAREDAVQGIPTRQFSDGYLETLAAYRKIADRMLSFDTLLFHGSAVAVDGKGYLFTAKSGTGKSTHTRLWLQTFGQRAFMVNDDKPLLQLTEEGVLVYGTPWDGKHRLSTNTAVPLTGICILERGERNEILQISAQEALPMLLQQSHRPMDPKDMAKLLPLVERLTKCLKFYRLRCNMELEAARVAYEGMGGSQV